MTPDATLMPEVGSTWQDATRRTLTVDAVVPGQRLGREVVGRVRRAGQDDHPYSCTLALWAALWRDVAPVAVVRQ